MEIQQGSWFSRVFGSNAYNQSQFKLETYQSKSLKSTDLLYKKNGNTVLKKGVFEVFRRLLDQPSLQKNQERQLFQMESALHELVQQEKFGPKDKDLVENLIELSQEKRTSFQADVSPQSMLSGDDLVYTEGDQPFLRDGVEAFFMYLLDKPNKTHLEKKQMIRVENALKNVALKPTLKGAAKMDTNTLQRVTDMLELSESKMDASSLQKVTDMLELSESKNKEFYIHEFDMSVIQGNDLVYEKGGQYYLKEGVETTINSLLIRGRLTAFQTRQYQEMVNALKNVIHQKPLAKEALDKAKELLSFDIDDYVGHELPKDSLVYEKDGTLFFKDGVLETVSYYLGKERSPSESHMFSKLTVALEEAVRTLGSPQPLPEEETAQGVLVQEPTLDPESEKRALALLQDVYLDEPDNSSTGVTQNAASPSLLKDGGFDEGGTYIASHIELMPNADVKDDASGIYTGAGSFKYTFMKPGTKEVKDGLIDDYTALALEKGVVSDECIGFEAQLRELVERNKRSTLEQQLSREERIKLNELHRQVLEVRNHLWSDQSE